MDENSGQIERGFISGAVSQSLFSTEIEFLLSLWANQSIRRDSHLYCLEKLHFVFVLPPM